MINPRLKIPFDSVGFIGGDFFFNQLEGLEKEWFELLDELNNNPQIKEVWLASSLVFKDTKWLDLTLDNLNKKQLLVSTSWDPVGRFKTNGAVDLWEKNVLYLLNKGINVSCTTILSQNLIDSFYTREFPAIIKKMSSWQFFRPSPIISQKHAEASSSEVSLDNFAAIKSLRSTEYQPENFFIKSREQFIKFCYDFIEKYGDAPLRYYINESSHSSSIATITNEIMHDRWNNYDTACKHEYVARQYLDSDECAFCDVAAIVG